MQKRLILLMLIMTPFTTRAQTLPHKIECYESVKQGQKFLPAASITLSGNEARIKYERANEATFEEEIHFAGYGQLPAQLNPNEWLLIKFSGGYHGMKVGIIVPRQVGVRGAYGHFAGDLKAPQNSIYRPGGYQRIGMLGYPGSAYSSYYAINETLQCEVHW